MLHPAQINPRPRGSNELTMIIKNNFFRAAVMSGYGCHIGRPISPATNGHRK